MRMLLKPLSFLCLLALAPDGAAFARPPGAQDSGQEAARQRRQQGRNLPVREIERRVVPMMQGAQYLGFDFDPQTDIYTLKFLRKRDSSVIWVDVDGRTGRIVRRTG
ncbi:MAG: hypothetical protein WDN24_21845 [Sphingomonas sp.]